MYGFLHAAARQLVRLIYTVCSYLGPQCKLLISHSQHGWPLHFSWSQKGCPLDGACEWHEVQWDSKTYHCQWMSYITPLQHVSSDGPCDSQMICWWPSTNIEQLLRLWWRWLFPCIYFSLVSGRCIEWQPDLLLTEWQDQLKQTCSIKLGSSSYFKKEPNKQKMPPRKSVYAYHYAIGCHIKIYSSTLISCLVSLYLSMCHIVMSPTHSIHAYLCLGFVMGILQVRIFHTVPVMGMGTYHTPICSVLLNPQYQTYLWYINHKNYYYYYITVFKKNRGGILWDGYHSYSLSEKMVGGTIVVAAANAAAAVAVACLPFTYPLTVYLCLHSHTPVHVHPSYLPLFALPHPCSSLQLYCHWCRCCSPTIVCPHPLSFMFAAIAAAGAAVVVTAAAITCPPSFTFVAVAAVVTTVCCQCLLFVSASASNIVSTYRINTQLTFKTCTVLST